MTITHDAFSALPPQIGHIVFDWNGTLIDDIDLAVHAVNRCAERFGVESVTHDRYRALFDFPIVDFYAALGFDLSLTPFTSIVQQYLDHFDANVARCALHDGSLDVLDAAREAGIGVSILSASHRDVLLGTLEAKGLSGRFEQVVGLSDNRAAGKAAEAARLQEALKRPAERTLYIGDTLHDYEVARSLGWRPILVSTGHQSTQRLRSSGAPVCAGLADLLVHLALVRPARNNNRRTDRD